MPVRVNEHGFLFDICWFACLVDTVCSFFFATGSKMSDEKWCFVKTSDGITIYIINFRLVAGPMVCVRVVSVCHFWSSSKVNNEKLENVMWWRDASGGKHLPIDCWSIESIASIIRWSRENQVIYLTLEKKSWTRLCIPNKTWAHCVLFFSKTKNIFSELRSRAANRLKPWHCCECKPANEVQRKEKFVGIITIEYYHRTAATFLK